MCERRHIGIDHPRRAYYEQAYGWNSYPIEWLEQLALLCKERRMQLACTSFLPEDVATVDPFVSIHKIASFENGDSRLMGEAMRTKKRIIISSGMRDGIEIPPLPHAEILHCTSSYPAPI